MAGINGMNKNMVSLLQQLPKAGKKSAPGQLSSSFQISTTTATASISMGMGINASSGAFVFQPANLSAFAGQKMTPLPKFSGLTKAESELSAEELREAIIAMAEKDKASGIQYMSNGNDIRLLIEKYTRAFSPDRQGIIERDAKGMMIPAGQCFEMGRIVDEKTGKAIANYQPDQGWRVYNTKEENDAAEPFYELYYETFFGHPSPTKTSSGSGMAGSGSSTTISAKTSVDYKA